MSRVYLKLSFITVSLNTPAYERVMGIFGLLKPGLTSLKEANFLFQCHKDDVE